MSIYTTVPKCVYTVYIYINMEKHSFPNKMICKWSRNTIFGLHRTGHIYVYANFMTGFMVYNLYIYNQYPKKVQMDQLSMLRKIV